MPYNKKQGLSSVPDIIVAFMSEIMQVSILYDCRFHYRFYSYYLTLMGFLNYWRSYGTVHNSFSLSHFHLLIHGPVYLVYFKGKASQNPIGMEMDLIEGSIPQLSELEIRNHNQGLNVNILPKPKSFAFFTNQWGTLKFVYGCPNVGMMGLLYIAAEQPNP